jgi:AcrR family transcriptional regulator
LLASTWAAVAAQPPGNRGLETLEAGVIGLLSGPLLLYNRNGDSVSDPIRNQRSVCQRTLAAVPAVNRPRPLRADAERNRQRVLEVAQQVFATEGLSVPIDEIARRAGLGVGTLYRHFPTKEALFEAIVIGRLEGLVEQARQGAGATDPGAAFFGFLSRMVEEGSAKKDFLAALASTGVDMGRIAAAKQRMKRAVKVLVERAQEAGALRSDVSDGDVLTLVMGAVGAADRRGAGIAERKRLLRVIFDGLRPQR